MKLKQVNIGEFGCLSDVSVTLSEGLNVIYGENGAGKSTFFSFLQTSLYGEKGGKAREKILPWNGNTAGGSISFSHGGDYVLQVKFGKTPRGDQCTLFHEISGQEQPISGWPGKELLSMGEETFLKTACVGQGQLAISNKGTDEIAEKLANFEQADVVSYTACHQTLETLLKDLRAKRGGGGLLNQAEAMVEELLVKERQGEQLAARGAEIYRRLEQIKQELSECRVLLSDWGKVKQTEHKHRMLEYQQKIEQLTSLIQEEPEDDGEAEQLARDWQQEADTLVRLQQQALTIPKEPPLLCTNEEFLRVTAGHNKGFFALKIASYLLAVLFLAVGWFVSPWFYVGTGISLAAALFWKSPKQPWEEYGANSSLEFSERYAESVKQHAAYEAAMEQYQQLKDQLQEHEKRLEEYREKGNKFGCESAEELFVLCQKNREKKEENQRAIQQKKTYEDLLQKELDQATMEEIMAIGEVERPPLSEQELYSRQMALTAEQERLKQELNHLFPQGQTPDVIRSARMEWEEKREAYRLKERALLTALEVLEQAYQEMEQQFGGELNRRAGQLLSQMTGGEYEEPRISRDYQVRLTEGVESHQLERFSGGLYDQTYLAFRLAMLELMGVEVPVLLDDVLMQYDDKRAEETMRCLEQYASRTKLQLLLFTCRKRDLLLAKELESVTCIEIL